MTAVVANDLARLLQQRRSIRRFLPTAIAATTVDRLLLLARTAPSGDNNQPGYFIALRGKPLAELSTALLATCQQEQQEDPGSAEYSYFPQPIPPAIRRRKAEVGRQLYRSLGIDRHNKKQRQAQYFRNYRFFDAPVGIVVTLAHNLGCGCFLDLGMALQNFALAAEAEGLSCCAIGSLAHCGDVIRQQLELSPSHRIICGLALGYADPQAAENKLRTKRQALHEYRQLRGF